MSHVLFVMVDDLLLDMDGYRAKNDPVLSHFEACKKMLKSVEDLALKDKTVRKIGDVILDVPDDKRLAYIKGYDQAMKFLTGSIEYDPYLMAQDYYHRLVIGDKIDRNPEYRLRERRKKGTLKKYFNGSSCFVNQDKLRKIYKDEITDAPDWNRSLVATLVRFKLRGSCDIVYLTASNKDKIENYIDKRNIGFDFPLERVHLDRRWNIDKDSLVDVLSKYGNQNSHFVFISKENDKYIKTAKSLGLGIVCVGDDMAKYRSEAGFHLNANTDIECAVKQELTEYASIGVKQRLKKINSKVINPYQSELKM